MKIHQSLPAAGDQREELREKGQFWTPDWVAEAMVAYALSGGAHELMDPAVGAGAFLTAASKEVQRAGLNVKLGGCELDPDVLDEAEANGVSREVLSRVEIRDFILDPPSRAFPAIVANPPYIRHHRVNSATKAKLHSLAEEKLGKRLDGRTGYHIFFLIRALTLLEPGGKLAFIMPADTCEGVYATDLWQWIASTFSLEGAVIFDADATPFPGVDTNAIILLIENSPPSVDLKWLHVTEQGTPDLRGALADLRGARTRKSVEVHRRTLSEAIETGLTRPNTPSFADDPKLGDFARTIRGIATGANEFFFMTQSEAIDRGIPNDLLVRAVGRTRDVQGPTLTRADLSALDAAGTPTFLLSTGDRALDDLPETVRTYIELNDHLKERSLIKARRLWYRSEERATPPFLFAYLGRRNTRFIRNKTNAVPLTGFLCVYPNRDDIPLDALWEALSASATHERLASVGKSYGGGAIKVEPRALERLPLDRIVVQETGLDRFIDVPHAEASAA